MTANISIMFILGLATVCSHDFFKTFSNLYSYKDIFVQHEKSRVVTVLRENGFQLDLSFKNTSNVYRYNFVDSEMVCTQKNVVANSSILLLEEIEDTFSLESLPDNLKDLKDKIASTFFRFLKNDLKKIANKKTEKFGKTAKSRKKFFGYKIFNESDFSDRFTKKYVNDSTIVFATVVYRIDYSVDPVSIITFNGHSEKKVNGEIIRKRLLEKFKNVCAESAGIKICFFKSLWKDNKYYFFDDRISSTDFSISDRFSTLILKLHYLSLGSEVPRDFYFVCDEKVLF
ncbi:hypothetical protein MHBO_000366 [Bonamia ostreae]|uniref:Uncharacterized protein n=1 Tax=Bonamia ostreae TaxID=126728 RepID=A0ABV2AFD4_9EUKA